MSDVKIYCYLCFRIGFGPTSSCMVKNFSSPDEKKALRETHESGRVCNDKKSTEK